MLPEIFYFSMKIMGKSFTDSQSIFHGESRKFIPDIIFLLTSTEKNNKQLRQLTRERERAKIV
jgi:hypothetical protein